MSLSSLYVIQVNLKIVNCGGAYRDCIKRNGDKNLDVECTLYKSLSFIFFFLKRTCI